MEPSPFTRQNERSAMSEQACPHAPNLSPRNDRLMVWLGPPFFSYQLPPLGWEVIKRAHNPAVAYTWRDILSLTGGRIPRVVVVADGSTPPPVTGMERFPCLTVFYAVDTHIHSWFPLYAQGFDLCLISLKDHLSLFHGKRLAVDRILWSPPYARDEARPAADLLPPGAGGPAGNTLSPNKKSAGCTKPEWEALFAGTVDPEVTPERTVFLRAVKERFPGLHITRGSFPALFPKAAIIFNECSRGDLNFRVFEALGMGGCLLTPMVGHGMSTLFKDGRELFVYPPGDADAAVAVMRALLEDEPLRRQAAAAGLACIDAGHRASHRAKSISDRLQALFADGTADRLIQDRLRNAADIHSRYLRLMYLLHAESVDSPPLREAYLRACKYRA